MREDDVVDLLKEFRENRGAFPPVTLLTPFVGKIACLLGLDCLPMVGSGHTTVVVTHRVAGCTGQKWGHVYLSSTQPGAVAAIG
jgi:hypothetical protein